MQWISEEYKTVFFEQLSLVMEKGDRDLCNRSTKTYVAPTCSCDAPPVASPQMGSFRTWKDLRIFFQGCYGLEPSELKILRVFQCPSRAELRAMFQVSDAPLLGVDSNGIPTGCQEVQFIDAGVTLYVLAEETEHASSCIYRIQVVSIVQTHVLGPTISHYNYTG
jgi:hypothetical protein